MSVYKLGARLMESIKGLILHEVTGWKRDSRLKMDYVLFLLLLGLSTSLGFSMFKDEKRPSHTIQITQHEEVRDQYGQYAVRYATDDGTIVSERGILKANAAGTGHVLMKEGSVSYQAPDGTTVYMEYVADENGFRPKGSHIPTTIEPRPE